MNFEFLQLATLLLEKGWSSPHLSPSVGPNAWATAQTITCLARMRRIVRELMHNDVLEEFGGFNFLKGEPCR